MEKEVLKSVQAYTPPFPLSRTGKAEILIVSDVQRIDTEMFAHLEFLSEIEEKGIKRFEGIKVGSGTVSNRKLLDPL